MPDVATSGDARAPSGCAHSCTLAFEPGALREDSWGGFVWVYLSHSGVVPKVVGPKGAQSAVKVTAVETPECLPGNGGGSSMAATRVLGTVWKIAVSRGHNKVAGMDDALLIYW